MSHVVCRMRRSSPSQTSYTDKGPVPDVGRFHSFDHISFFVNNAKQGTLCPYFSRNPHPHLAADWYCIRFGFKHIAYKGLETGERETVRHVIKLNDVCFPE